MTALRTPTVVHCKGSVPYDQYIGRGRCPTTGQTNPYYNRFSHRPSTYPDIVQVKTVEEAVECFARWLFEPKQADLLARVRRELPNKTLACWCVQKGDEPCHGWFLLRVANPDLEL